MTKAEIEFLRAAGFSIAEIMAMSPVQSDETATVTQPGSDTAAGQNAQTETPAQPASGAQAPEQPAQPAAGPAQTAPAQPASTDTNPEMTRLLTQILAAVQAGNRSGAALPTPEKKKSPEEIAGELY